jgi:pre-mRNA-splicing factor CWC22
MLLECCSQERTYLRYYGLLGQRFCMINKVFQENFEKCFVQQYSMIHRLETNKLRNVAKFFAHLLGTDALSWHVLAYIRLTEEDTTSSSRIFIKILFQVCCECATELLLLSHENCLRFVKIWMYLDTI